MVNSTRQIFDQQLESLQYDILSLAEMVESQLVEAMKALRKRDVTIATRVRAYDKRVNVKRYKIEERAYTLLALQQPLAHDMRRIVAAVSIVTNLERMGDHAAGIAHIVQDFKGAKATVEIPEFDEMVEIAIADLRDAMRALETGDAVLAREVIRRDEQVDKLYHQVYVKMLSMIAQDPTLVEEATNLLRAAHDLERFSDRVGNICERISYVITGVLYEEYPDETA